jgi:putative chitinase
MLQGMFPGRLRQAHLADVEAGLPSLNQQMIEAEINTPRRIAAFLTTLVFESWCEYNVHEVGDTRVFGGRGYIQLTGQANYESAGRSLGVDLISNPDLALSLEWSAKIARWYWTIARPNCNGYADTLRMGKINAAIGYPRSADGSNDNARCAAFAKALLYLTGEPEVTVDCNR